MPHFTTSLFFFTPLRCDPAKTKSEALTKLKFEGRVFPFGALMYYKPDPKKLPHTHAPLSKPGLFLGWQLGPGHSWTRLYKVLDYESLLQGNYVIQAVREVTLHKCEPQKFHFPLANARERALEKFETLDIPSLISCLPTVEQAERIGVLKSSPDADPNVVAARERAANAPQPKPALEQHENDPNREDRAIPGSLNLATTRS